MADPNELDRLMSLDPLELSAQDIDSIISYQRKARLSAEAGIKPKRGKSSTPIDLAAIGLGGSKQDFKKRKFT